MLKREPLTDPLLIAKLASFTSGQTNQRLGKIPLVLGMPILIAQNFDVEGGIVNGSTGTLKRIRYRVDDNGLRHLTSCIVEVVDTRADTLPYLASHHVAVLEDQVDLRFTHLHSRKS
ncbi:hypothetical protein JAAARDRAFT_135832, partial [Jaapia argillacea MUCL 33604]